MTYQRRSKKKIEKEKQIVPKEYIEEKNLKIGLENPEKY